MLNRKTMRIAIGAALALALVVGAVGVSAQSSDPATPFLGILFSASDDNAVVVERVMPGSPAADAGLEAGDVITEVAGDAVTVDNIREALASYSAGDEVALTVRRGEDTLEISVTLGDMPGFGGGFPSGRRGPGDGRGHHGGRGPQGEQDNRGFRGEGFPPFGQGMPFGGMMLMGGGRLGVQFETLNETIAEENNLDVTEGALITDVAPDSPAADAGLQVGDVVTAVDGDVVDAERTLRDRMVAYEPGDVVTLSVLRDGESLDLEVTIGEPRFPREMFEGMPYGRFEIPFDDFDFQFQPPMGGGAQPPASSGAPWL